MASSTKSNRLSQIRADLKAGKLKPQVAHELARAERLYRLRLYTEAAVRLGRAMEADLYATAADLGLDLTDRVIPDLEAIRQEIQGAQAKIAFSQQFSDIRKMSDTVTRLVITLLELANNDRSRAGQASSEPRRNRRLYEDFKQHIDEATLKRRLAAEGSIVDQVQRIRNRAAHAPVDGGKQEITAGEFRLLTREVDKVLGLLLDVRLGAISKQRALTAQASTSVQAQAFAVESQ